MLTETSSGLWCAAGRFHIDPWQPVERAVITHAHGDHARPGSAAYLCASPCEPLLRRRFGADCPIESIPYGQALTIGDVRLSFHPAGHVLGSAQIRLESNDGVWVVAATTSARPIRPARRSSRFVAMTFVTESTFGLPIYRWDSTETVIADHRRLVDCQSRGVGGRRCCSATRSARRSACSRS